MSKTFTASDVAKIAALANIPVSQDEAKQFAVGFTKTLSVVDALFAVNVTGVSPTAHVTGLENVFREDVIDANRVFSQDEALANAAKRYKGFFVVPYILGQE